MTGGDIPRKVDMSYGLKFFDGSSRVRTCLYITVAFAILAGGVSTPPTASAATKIPTAFYQFGTPRVKPSQIQVGNISQLQSLRWKKWGRSVSTARGYFFMCDAGSASGDCTKIRVRVRASSRDFCRGEKMYRKITVKAVSGSTAGPLPLSKDWRKDCGHGALEG